MTMAESIAWLLLALVGLAGSWLCSGMETGMYTLNRIRLMVRSEPPAGGTGDRSARILRHEVDRPEHLLGTILIGNNLFAYLAAAAITAILSGRGYAEMQVLIINILILTPLILIFCEALPKELFRIEGDRLAYFFAPVMTALRLIFTLLPAVPLVVWFARASARLIGVEGEIGLAVSARERVATLLKETVSQGALSPAQAKLVDRAIAFHRLTVADEMVPWPRVVAIRGEWDRRRLLRLMARRPYSRYPVVETAPANVQGGSGGAPPLRHGARPTLRIAGVIHQADVYLRPRGAIRDLLVEPVRLGPGTTLRDALLQLRDNPSGMIVVEDHGRPLGILTVKDLAEPLTGVLEE